MSDINKEKKFSGISVEHKVRTSLDDMHRMHSHIFNELYFLNSGKRRYFINNSIYDVVPGNLVIIPKGVLHKTTSVDYKAGFDRHGVYFDDEIIKKLKLHLDEKLINAFLKSECLILPEAIAKSIRRQFELMNAEKETNDTYSKAFIENSLCCIILLAMRHGTKKALKQGEDFGQMQKAISYINEHYAEDITLKSVARILLMEETYFSKKFKQLTGLGFKEFLIQTRIKKAEELLATEIDMEISKISEKCGFSSSNYFGDAFKKINGISPRQYRKLF